MRDVKYAMRFPTGEALPLVFYTGDRVTITAGVASSAEAALPGSLVVVRATHDMWIRFGQTGLGAAAAGDDSMLFPAGVEVVVTREDETHFRVIRAGADDADVQIEKVEVQRG